MEKNIWKMTDIPFYKYHALGNDYIVMDPSRMPPLELTPARIEKICHRNFGVGSDGILYGPLPHKKEGALSDGYALKIFNPDGSEAEKSGNGIRIFSQYLKDAGYVEGAFHLHTLGGDVFVEFLPDGRIKVDMGSAIFQSDLVPVAGPVREVVSEQLTILDTPYKINCVSMGNPHCVIPLEEISENLARQIGPLIENHPQFPNRINMQLLKVRDRKNIQIEIWERGAGYTLASGSSSCAAASVAYKLGLTDSDMTVHMPGGVIGIEILPSGHVMMTGPVSPVGWGYLHSTMV